LNAGFTVTGRDNTHPDRTAEVRTRTPVPVAVELSRMASYRKGTAAVSDSAAIRFCLPCRPDSFCREHDARYQPPGPQSWGMEEVAEGRSPSARPNLWHGRRQNRRVGFAHHRWLCPGINHALPLLSADVGRGLGASLAALDQRRAGNGV